MNLIRYFLVIVLAVFLSACGGGGGSAGNPGGIAPAVPVPPVVLPLFTTAPESLTTAVGAAQEFSITGGSSPYSVVSNDAAVVTAGVNGSKLTIGGIASGTALILIRDAVGASVSVNVTVRGAALRELFTTATSSVVVSVGPASAQTYNVGGGTAPYTVISSNTSVVAVGLAGSTLTVTGVTIGNANVVVRDSVGASVTVAVTVQPIGNLALFTTAPASGVTVAVGTSLTYIVGGGSGSPYLATSTNIGVVTANLTGTTLTLTGVAIGTANVVVRDSAGGLVTFSVTVGAIPVFVTPNSSTSNIISAQDDSFIVATITGGTPPYRSSVLDASVASATIAVENFTSTLKMKPLGVGQTIVTVFDANNQSVPYSLTVVAITPGIRLSPSVVTVSEVDTKPVTLTVFGAAQGTVNVFSSDLTLLTATIAADNRTVTITTGTKGNRCVASDVGVTFTVVDSTRAIGTALVTIKDNGNRAAVAAVGAMPAVAADPCPP